MKDVVSAAAERSVRVFFKTGREMDQLLQGVAHQGVAALAGEYLYASIEEIVHASMSRPDEALILAADHITDEGNLG